MKSITPVSRDRKLADYLFIFIVGWTATGAIVAAFSCQVPRPWDYITGQCLSMVCHEHIESPILKLLLR